MIPNGFRLLAHLLALVLFNALGTLNAMAAGTLAFAPSGPIISCNADPNCGDRFQINPVNLGLVFTANANFSVAALGFYFTSDDTAPEEVGLYDSSQILLASAIVSLSDPNVSGYLFHSIEPVALTSGNQYTLVAFTGFNDWSYGSTPPIQAAEVTYDYHDAVYTGSLAFPTNTAGAAGGPNGTYYGPDFVIESAIPIPEPCSLVMFASALGGFGIIGLALRLRRFIGSLGSRWLAACPTT